MNILNINNYISLQNSGMNISAEVMILNIEGINVMQIYKNIPRPMEGHDIESVFNLLLFSPYPVVIRKATYYPQLKRGLATIGNLPLNTCLSDYIESMDGSLLGPFMNNNVIAHYNEKLDSRRYITYMSRTDSLVSAMLYQWLEHIFIKTSEGSLRITDIISRFTQRMGGIGDTEVLRLLLKLNLLGFFLIQTEDNKNDFILSKTVSNDKQTVTLYDRFEVASFISQSLENKSYNITLISADKYHTIDLVRMKDDNEDIKTFCRGVLRDFKKLTAVGNNEQSLPVDAISPQIRLMFFSRVKQLPFKLFDDFNTEEMRNSNFSIKDVDYIRKTHIYRIWGIDIVDMSILGLLKIRSLSLREIVEKVSNYTPAEIYRSLMALTILGVISVNPETDTRNIPAQTTSKNDIPNGHSLLGKLMERIKRI